MQHAATREVPLRRREVALPIKEVRLPAEAAVPIPHHPEAQAPPEAPHTLLPAGVHLPPAPSAAAAPEALAAAAADAQAVVADNIRQSELSPKHR